MAEGRERLLDSAEELFDRYGIDGVSTRAITQAAGHRNNAAIHYHFGSRAELVEAVLTRYRTDVDQHRHRLLDELEAKGTPSLEGVVRALYVPLVDLLEQPSGRRHLRLMSQAATHPSFVSRVDLRVASSIVRAGMLLLAQLPDLHGRVLEQRMYTLVAMSLSTLGRQAWLIDGEEPGRSPLAPDVLEDELVRTALGLLRA